MIVTHIFFDVSASRSLVATMCIVDRPCQDLTDRSTCAHHVEVMAERIPDEEWTPGVGCLTPGKGLMLRLYVDADGPPIELPIACTNPMGQEADEADEVQ